MLDDNLRFLLRIAVFLLALTGSEVLLCHDSSSFTEAPHRHFSFTMAYLPPSRLGQPGPKATGDVSRLQPVHADSNASDHSAEDAQRLPQNTNMSVLTSLLLGIVGGLVTSACVFFFGRIWRLNIEPWFEDLVYKDARIEGNWRGETTRNSIPRVVVWEISQTGHRITATATPISGPNEGKRFNVEGMFRNSVLTVTYCMQSNQTLERGCLALKLINNGQRLQGHILRYDGLKEKVESAPYCLEREGATTTPSPSTDEKTSKAVDQPDN